MDATRHAPAAGLTLGAIDGRTLGRFLLRFALAFALLCLPLPFVGASYVRAFCAGATLVVPDPARAERYALSFESGQEAVGASHARSWQAMLTVRALASHTRVRLPIETMSLSYLPIVTFLALALATRIQDKKRWAALLGLGFVLIVLVTSLLVALSIVVVLDDLSPIHVLGPRGPLVIALSVLFNALMAPGMTYAVPVLLWWLLVRATRPALDPLRQ